MFDGRIFVCADSHGNSVSIRYFMDQINCPTKDDVIIIAGDAGFEYQDHIMGAAKKQAKKFAGTWIVMRGNHDSCYWAEHTHENEQEEIEPNQGWSILENGVDQYLYQDKYPNILYVRDSGGIYTIGKYNILFLPGAFSVDKQIRVLRGWPYNPNEQLSIEEQNDMIDIVLNFLDMGGEIHYVIGHSFPLKLEPDIKKLYIDGVNQSKVDKRTEQWLDAMSLLFEPSNNPAFKKYIGGHFHGDLSMDNGKYEMVYKDMIQL